MLTTEEKGRLEKFALSRGGHVLYKPCGTPIYVNADNDETVIADRNMIEWFFGPFAGQILDKGE